MKNMRSTGQMFQRIQEYRLKELAIRDGRIDILHSARMAFHMFSVAEQIVGQQKNGWDSTFPITEFTECRFVDEEMEKKILEGLICLFLILLALVAVAVPKRSSCNRQRDDEEQLEYLKRMEKET